MVWLGYNYREGRVQLGSKDMSHVIKDSLKCNALKLKETLNSVWM